MAGCTEDSCEIWVRVVRVNGQAEWVYPVGARLEYCLSRILHGVRCEVSIHVVWLAIGQDQQQAMTGRLRGEHCRRMTNRGTEPRVSAGFDSGDSPSNRLAVRFAERLQRRDAYIGCANTGKTENRVGVAECIERLACDEQCRLLDLDHPTPVTDHIPGGRAHIHENRHVQPVIG